MNFGDLLQKSTHVVSIWNLKNQAPTEATTPVKQLLFSYQGPWETHGTAGTPWRVLSSAYMEMGDLHKGKMAVPIRHQLAGCLRTGIPISWDMKHINPIRIGSF